MKKLIIFTAITGVIIISFMIMPMVLKNNSSELGILLKNRNYRGAVYYIFNIKSPVKPKKPIKKTNVHAMPEKDQKELLLDVKKDMQIYEKTTNNIGDLTKVMDGKALETVTENMNKLQLLGRVRVRNFEDEKFSIKGYVKGVAQVTFEFTDRSYDYYAKTKKIATKARNIKRKLALAVQKKDNVWKIIEILQPQVKSATKGKT